MKGKLNENFEKKGNLTFSTKIGEHVQLQTEHNQISFKRGEL